MKIGKFVTHATPEAGNFSTKIRNSNASLPSAKEISGLRFELGSDLWKCVQLIVHHKKKNLSKVYSSRRLRAIELFEYNIWGEEFEGPRRKIARGKCVWHCLLKRHLQKGNRSQR